MSDQPSSIPPTDSKTEDSQKPEFNDEGFQPVDQATSAGLTHSSFNATNDDGFKGFGNQGFQPIAAPGFLQTGFQPVGRNLTIDAEKYTEIGKAVRAAQEALDKLRNLVSDIAFIPQK
ncbi:MAG: hypothetical protein ASARMPRED_003262 [Alectoria sarmentosa]|nr:MAG: hypothetical protein ASARMPRED_003262 [Alectoria sarmentosa]